MLVILGLINWFIEVISSSPWLPRKTLCFTTGNWFLHSHAIIPEANGDIFKIALSGLHLALPAQLGWLKEGVSAWWEQIKVLTNPWFPTWLVASILDRSAWVGCSSFWSFLIHEFYLLFRTYLKWQKSPTTVNVGRASPVMAMGPSYEDSASALLSHLFMPCLCCVMLVSHWWPGSPGRDMVAWLAALAQLRLLVPAEAFTCWVGSSASWGCRAGRDGADC